MPFEWNRVAGTAVRLFPRVLPADRVNDRIAVPPNQGVGIFFQGLWEVAFLLAMLPNTNNALALFGRIFDFPVHPIAILGLGGDVADEHSSPVDGGGKDLRLYVVLIGSIVELPCMDGGIPDLDPFRSQKILQLLEPVIVLMDMANEHVLFLCHLSPPLFSRGLKIVAMYATTAERIADLFALIK